MQTDKPILPLTDKWLDTDIWNQYLDYQKTLLDNSENPSWFRCAWLYVECYLYRRIQEGISLRCVSIPAHTSVDVYALRVKVRSLPNLFSHL